MIIDSSNSSSSIPEMFVALTSLEPSAERSNMIIEFANTFWDSMLPEQQEAFFECYVFNSPSH